jgi:molybdenum cofactor cytidylyltransferase
VFVTGLVLAAGASRRLGQAKQLLPYHGSTLLESTLALARSCRFDQLLLTLGGAAAAIRRRIDLSGVEVVENPQFSSGCGSSISRAMGAVEPRSDGVVLLLGDQPGVSAGSVRGLVEHAGGAAIGVCRYTGDDGLGHPFWFHREVFGDLATLHGDKAVWKLLHSGRYEAVEMPVEGTVPIDVDTWQDYRTLLSHRAPS